jgi:hypothetical protein
MKGKIETLKEQIGFYYSYLAFNFRLEGLDFLGVTWFKKLNEKIEAVERFFIRRICCGEVDTMTLWVELFFHDALDGCEEIKSRFELIANFIVSCGENMFQMKLVVGLATKLVAIGEKRERK